MNLKVGLKLWWTERQASGAACNDSTSCPTAIAWLIVVVVSCLGSAGLGELSAATVPAGFTETEVAGPWSDAVGTAFEDNGRTYVWERTGQVWFKDPGAASFSLLVDI